MIFRRAKPVSLDTVSIEPRTPKERRLLTSIKERRHATDEVINSLQHVIRRHKLESK